MLEALIFDVDGTVAETEGLHRRAFNVAFEESGLGLRWDEDEYRRLLAVAGGRERIARSLAERGRALGGEAIARAHAAKTRHYAALLAREGVPWRPGVRRILGEARRAGVRLALATTTSEANLAPLFAPVLGPRWRSWFAAVVTGEAVARKKPAPDAYHAALAALALDPARAVAFEDSAHGVAAARAAGVPVVAAASRWLPADDLSAADLVLPHLGDADAPWDAPHPALGTRRLSVRGLAAWHARRFAAAPVRTSDPGRSPCPPPA